MLWRPLLHGKHTFLTALSLAVVAACAIAPSALAARANLWVDTDGGSCARRGSANHYRDGRACGGLRAAYRAAQSGDVILVRRGTYRRQVIPGGSKKVTIASAPGTRPRLGTTDVRASNVVLRGFAIRRTDDPGASVATLSVRGHDNVIKGVSVNTMFRSQRQGLFAGGHRNVFKYGSTYNVVDEKGALVAGARTTFDHFKFHDVRLTSSSVHNECIYSDGPQLTVRNSRFWHCSTMDLFITRGTWWNQPLYGGITLVNNVFEHATMEGANSWHYYSLNINTAASDGQVAIPELRNWRVVNNTFETPVGADHVRGPNTLWANNVGSWPCFAGATFSHNVGKKCSASDVRVRRPTSCGPPVCGRVRNARQGWVNPAKHNFHLRRTAKAINRASPKLAPVRDLDGRRRGSNPEAGAYER